MTDHTEMQIPDDVMEAAREAYDAAFFFGEAEVGAIVKSIARAILAERTRRAKIAEELESALKELVYEVTHLSPERDDGSHDCTISGLALAKARSAIRASVDK